MQKRKIIKIIKQKFAHDIFQYQSFLQKKEKKHAKIFKQILQLRRKNASKYLHLDILISAGYKEGRVTLYNLQDIFSIKSPMCSVYIPTLHYLAPPVVKPD